MLRLARNNQSIHFYTFLPMLLLMLSTSLIAGVGESAVITLIFPPGARSTGMGEAFTGLADDATATYYNPAGLGQSPQANSWKAYLSDSKNGFTAIAAKKNRTFTEKELIWAGTRSGVLRFNGKVWEKHDIYLIEEDDDLESVVKNYISVDDNQKLLDALWELKKYNKIGMKRFDIINESIKRVLIQKKPDSADSIAYYISRQIMELEMFERSEEKAHSIISESTDSATADLLAKDIINVFAEVDDKKFSDLTDIKVPFSIAIQDSVTSMVLDNAGRVWIGTFGGLWRFNKDEWNYFSTTDGLPSNNIVSLSAGKNGEIAVGTDRGLAVYESGSWTITDSIKDLGSSYISAVTFAEDKSIYVGTPEGMAKISGKTTTLFDTSSGLISKSVHALFFDSENRLWIGGDNGISMYNGSVWKRYKFPDSKVSSFAEQENGNIWIGTNKGVISYKDGKVDVDRSGNATENPPEWKSFHSKNALVGNVASAITVHDNDIWIATDKAINQYDNAEKQVFLFFEQLLPALMLRELWHAYGSFVYPTQDWGTLALSINYINMGENTLTDALGREFKKTRSWEGVFGVSWALPIKDDFSIGLNGKFVYSALAPGYGENGEGVGRTFAIDAALLKRNLLLKNLDLGFVMQNMGPHIFYVNRDNLDPIPFTLRLGLVYNAFQTPVWDLKLLFDMHKELVKNHFDGEPDNFLKAIGSDLFTDKEEDWKYELQEINYNLGLEFWYANFLAFRNGFLLDYIGERYEWTFGFGVKYSKLNFDWSYIVSPEGFLKKTLSSINSEKEGATGVRNGQWRASFLFRF